jgi:hypothetical protein
MEETIRSQPKQNLRTGERRYGGNYPTKNGTRGTSEGSNQIEEKQVSFRINDAKENIRRDPGHENLRESGDISAIMHLGPSIRIEYEKLQIKIE